MIHAGVITSCGLSGTVEVPVAGGREKGRLTGGVTGDLSMEKRTGSAPMQVVGEIVSVHLEEGFVLVKRYLQAGSFGKSDLIAAVSPQGTASSLVLTGEKLGRFYAADVQKGQPARGDVVVIRNPKEKKAVQSGIEQRAEE